MNRRAFVGSAALFAAVIATGAGLAWWKHTTSADAAAEAAAMSATEMAEVVAVATAQPREHRSAVSAVGTVLATRSVTLRNEVAGRVVSAALTPGTIVEPGAVLV